MQCQWHGVQGGISFFLNFYLRNMYLYLFITTNLLWFPEKSICP